MNNEVVYFTKMGTSKRIAQKIAQRLSYEAIQIKESLNWKRTVGFLVGGFYASKNIKSERSIHKNIDEADELIIVTPLWAGGVTPAIRALLKYTPTEKIHLVVTSNGGRIRKRTGFKSVCDIVKNKDNEDAMVDRFAKSILAEDGNNGR